MLISVLQGHHKRYLLSSRTLDTDIVDYLMHESRQHRLYAAITSSAQSVVLKVRKINDIAKALPSNEDLVRVKLLSCLDISVV